MPSKNDALKMSEISIIFGILNNKHKNVGICVFCPITC